MVYLAPLSMRS